MNSRLGFLRARSSRVTRVTWAPCHEGGEVRWHPVQRVKARVCFFHVRAAKEVACGTRKQVHPSPRAGFETIVARLCQAARGSEHFERSCEPVLTSGPPSCPAHPKADCSKLVGDRKSGRAVELGGRVLVSDENSCMACTNT